MKKAVVIITSGFEPMEAITCIDLLNRGGVNVVTLSIEKELTVKGANGVTILCDELFTKDIENVDLIVLPGGAGTWNYIKNQELTEYLQKMNKEKVTIGAICAAPTYLHEIGVLDGKRATCFTSMKDLLEGKNTTYVNESVVIDGNIITSRGPGTAVLFGLQLVKTLLGDEVKMDVEEKLLI